MWVILGGSEGTFLEKLGDVDSRMIVHLRVAVGRVAHGG